MDKETVRKNRERFHQKSEKGYKEMLESEFNDVAKMITTAEAIFSEPFKEVIRCGVECAIDDGRMDNIIELNSKISKILSARRRGDAILALVFELSKHSSHLLEVNKTCNK